MNSLRPVLFLAFLLTVLTASGQTGMQHSHAADSIAFVNAPWQRDTIEGMCYMRHHFHQKQLFGTNQYFCVVELPKATNMRLHFVADSHLTTLSDFALRHHAAAAINGSYFNMRTGEPICYLRIDGETRGVNTPGRTDTVNRKYYQYATIRLLRTGKPRFRVPDSLRNAENAMKDSNLMTAGPMLLCKGDCVPQQMEKRFVSGRHNRSAIGLKPDGTVVLLVVDGRAKGESEGLTLPELALVMRWLGCCDAVNLDGGGSSTLYVRGQGTEGIVNHPSDNGRFDPYGQRPIANAILIY